MTEIDFDRFQADTAPVEILLAPNVTVRREPLVFPPVSGFAALDRLELTVRMGDIRGQTDPALVVLLEGSTDDGDSWTTVHSWTFTGNGEAFLVENSPPDMLRVTLTPAGGLKEAVFSGLAAAPAAYNTPGGENGGSQPIQVYKVPIAFDTPGIVTTGVATGYTAAVGDLLIILAYSITTAWNGTSPYGALRIGSNDPFTGGGINPNDMTVTDSDLNNGTSGPPVGGSLGTTIVNQAGAVTFLIFNNDSGGDPGASQGVGNIVFMVVPAT